MKGDITQRDLGKLLKLSQAQVCHLQMNCGMPCNRVPALEWAATHLLALGSTTLKDGEQTNIDRAKQRADEKAAELARVEALQRELAELTLRGLNERILQNCVTGLCVCLTVHDDEETRHRFEKNEGVLRGVCNRHWRWCGKNVYAVEREKRENVGARLRPMIEELERRCIAAIYAFIDKDGVISYKAAGHESIVFAMWEEETGERWTKKDSADWWKPKTSQDD